MVKHFQHFASVAEFEREKPSTAPLVASMPDREGKLIFFRSASGRESYLTQGEAHFRVGASPLGGSARLL